MIFIHELEWPLVILPPWTLSPSGYFFCKICYGGKIGYNQTISIRKCPVLWIGWTQIWPKLYSFWVIKPCSVEMSKKFQRFPAIYLYLHLFRNYLICKYYIYTKLIHHLPHQVMQGKVALESLGQAKYLSIKFMKS